MRIASEKIGEVSAQAAILQRYPDAIQLEASLPGAGKNGQFDQIYLDPVSDRLIIVEAKGGNSDWGSRIDLKNTRAQQGSGSYMESVIANYEAKLELARKGDINFSPEEYDALKTTVTQLRSHSADNRIEYLGVKQPATDDGVKPSAQLYQFDISKNKDSEND